MLLEKKRLSVEDRDAQTALELPDREMMLVFVVIGSILSGNTIVIPVQNNNVALQVCAIVEAIDVNLLSLEADELTCTVQQNQPGP